MKFSRLWDGVILAAGLVVLWAIVPTDTTLVLQIAKPILSILLVTIYLRVSFVRLPSLLVRQAIRAGRFICQQLRRFVEWGSEASLDELETLTEQASKKWTQAIKNNNNPMGSAISAPFRRMYRWMLAAAILLFVFAVVGAIHTDCSDIALALTVECVVIVVTIILCTIETSLIHSDFCGDGPSVFLFLAHMTCASLMLMTVVGPLMGPTEPSTGFLTERHTLNFGLLGGTEWGISISNGVIILIALVLIIGLCLAGVFASINRLVEGLSSLLAEDTLSQAEAISCEQSEPAKTA